MSCSHGIAEGATTPETLRHRDQADIGTLEREGSPSADGESHFGGEALRQKRQRG